MRILLVEDDLHLGDSVTTGLKQHGYTVDWLKTGDTVEQSLQNEAFDLMILDLGLPGKSGLSVLKSLRANHNLLPVIILTAHDDMKNRVELLDFGADDYMTKPFDMEELAARIRAVQRRHGSERAESTIAYKNLMLDPASHRLEREGEEVTLSRREFTLLHKLLENAGRVLSRSHLTQVLYGWEDDIDSNALEVHIHNLRKKLGNDLIRTIRGVGYIVEKPDEAS